MAKQHTSTARKLSTGAHPSEAPEGAELAKTIASAAADKKGRDIEIIDVRGKVDYADFIVVMSGSSDRQVQALARHIEESLKVKHGTRSSGIEGLPKASWVLIDYGDVIVHVFHEHTRPYYDLENLWIDAKRLPFEQPSH